MVGGLGSRQQRFSSVQQFMRSNLLGVGLAMAFVFGAGPALAAAQDAEAQELADQAIFTDYLQLDFTAAEKKLKKAIDLCDRGSCSPTVHAQVYRDLAVIYVTGMKRQDEGKKLLVRALQLDSRVALDADLTTPDLIRVFNEAKEEFERAPEPPPKPAKSSGTPKASAAEAQENDPAENAAPEPPAGSLDDGGSADCPPDFPGCEPIADKSEAADEDEDDAELGVRNWLSAGLQQDFLMFSSATGVCNADRPPELSCFRAGDDFRDPNTEGTAGEGGEVGAGFRPATTRLLIGYERTFFPNVTLGLRLGYAIGGGPAEPGGAAFVPIHAEVRGSYWFAPLELRRLRPYATVGGGLAQVDGSVTTQLVDRNQQGQIALSRVTVWKKTGTTFASLGAGAMYPLSERGGVTAELKALLLFPSSGASFSLQAGYTHGF